MKYLSQYWKSSIPELLVACMKLPEMTIDEWWKSLSEA